MAIEVSELAGEIRRVLSVDGGRRRVPDTLRRRVVAAIAKHRASGGAAREVIAALGLHEVTVYRWMRELRGKGAAQDGFAMVRVVPSRASTMAPGASVERAGRGEIVVTTPRGLRVEGLDVDALCTLLARFG